MRKILAAACIAAMLPAVSFALTDQEVRAQINALLAEIAQLQQLLNALQGESATTPQVAAPAGGSIICSLSRYPLSRGAEGRDVSLVQQFLKSLGFFPGTITSFFGPLTEQALTDFQLQSGLVSERSEGGIFGRRTFNYVLGRFCTTPIATPTPTPVVYTPPTQCVTPPSIPAISCSGSWVKTYSSACHVGWTCVASSAPATPSNKPPLISAIVGPTLLKPDEVGTWSVHATDPEGGALLYSFVWGDEGSTLSQILNIAREGTKYGSQATSTHAYSKTGAYTIVAFAKDPAGSDTSATLSIQVRSPEATSAQPQLSTDGSCVLNGKVTKNNDMIANPSCSGTCNYPYLQCISGQWVAIPSASAASAATAQGKIYPCYMDGQGYEVDPAVASCGTYISWAATPSDAKAENTSCDKFLKADPICTAEGWSSNLWAGGYLGSRGVSVGCKAANEIPTPYSTNKTFYVPGNMKVIGSRCFKDDATQTNCDPHYICKRDGWWRLDASGFDVEKMTSAPWIVPDQFYPQF